MSREPTASFVAFVNDIATKVVAPTTTFDQVSPTAAAVNIQASALSSYDSSS